MVVLFSKLFVRGGNYDTNLDLVGEGGNYWKSKAASKETTTKARDWHFRKTIWYMDDAWYKGNGFSLRCVVR